MQKCLLHLWILKASSWAQYKNNKGRWKTIKCVFGPLSRCSYSTKKHRNSFLSFVCVRLCRNGFDKAALSPAPPAQAFIAAKFDLFTNTHIIFLVGRCVQLLWAEADKTCYCDAIHYQLNWMHNGCPWLHQSTFNQTAGAGFMCRCVKTLSHDIHQHTST